MQCAVGANVGTDESIKNKSLIVRIFRKWSFPSGTTSINPDSLSNPDFLFIAPNSPCSHLAGSLWFKPKWDHKKRLSNKFRRSLFSFSQAKNKAFMLKFSAKAFAMS